MIGYGPEDSNFALELTYNYGIESYDKGNDLLYIALALDLDETKAKAQAAGYPYEEVEGGKALLLHDPDKYT